jgi:transcriptional/translational regulatory protein YebC/TACO1
LIALDAINEDALLELTLNNGAEDVKTHTDHFEVLCHV